jgi:hypothetical protein
MWEMNCVFIVDVATPLNNQGVVTFKKYFWQYSLLEVHVMNSIRVKAK